MPSGDFNRSIEREKEGEEEERESEGENRTNFHSGGTGLQARKDVTEKSKFIFFSFF